MNIAEYLSSSHPDDLRYRLSIAYAVRNLEEQQRQVRLQFNNVLLLYNIKFISTSVMMNYYISYLRN